MLTVDQCEQTAIINCVFLTMLFVVIWSFIQSQCLFVYCMITTLF